MNNYGCKEEQVSEKKCKTVQKCVKNIKESLKNGKPPPKSDQPIVQHLSNCRTLFQQYLGCLIHAIS